VFFFYESYISITGTTTTPHPFLQTDDFWHAQPQTSFFGFSPKLERAQPQPSFLGFSPKLEHAQPQPSFLGFSPKLEHAQPQPSFLGFLPKLKQCIATDFLFCFSAQGRIASLHVLYDEV
jgi:hypothetical protein